jgi:hypothetical protein
MAAGKGWNVDFPHCIFGEWNSSLFSSSALALWPSLPVNCYSDDEGANDPQNAQGPQPPAMSPRL